MRAQSTGVPIVIGFAIFVGLAGLLWLPVDDPSPEPNDRTKEREAGAHPRGIVFRSAARGPDRPPGALLKAQQHREDMLSYQAARAMQRVGFLPTGINSSSWKLLGPPNVAGRLRSILIHPVFDNAMLVGAATGGVWRTVNGGQSWVPADDFMASVTIGCMAMDPLTPATVYAGSGEGFFDAAQGTSNTAVIQGEGIFKSNDFGVNWFLLASTALNLDFRFVNRIAVAAPDSQSRIILAATGTGIFRSLDGGATWAKVFNGRTFDVKFRPFDSQRVVAADEHGTLLFSSDAGVTWQFASGSPVEDARVELAWAPSVPNLVYAATHDNAGSMYVSVSVNFGADYVRVTIPHQPPLDGFGDYAKTLWVDPTNASRLLLGATFLYKSTDGGVTFTEIGAGHADHHVLIEHPDYGSAVNKIVFNGNDGGIYKYDDPFSAAPTITDLNDSLVTTQFYGADIHPSGAVVGGTQDNGTFAFDPQTQQWNPAKGGDGAFTAIKPENPDVMYYQTQGLEVFRSDDGGYDEIPIFSSTGRNEDSNFIAPLELDPAPNSDRLYLGGRSLWRTLEPLTFVVPWTAIKNPIPNCPSPAPLGGDPPPSHQTDNSPCNISAIAISPRNSAWIWVGYNNGEVWATTTGLEESPFWIRRDNSGVGLPDRWCSDIVADPHDEHRAYVSFLGYERKGVWKTEDLGSTWINISGVGPTALPGLPVNGLAVHPILPGWLYAATDLGIYSSTDDGATWSASNVGPSNVSVDELVWKDNKSLMAVTHGRGLWIVDSFDDCNGNMVPDNADISSDFSDDNNFNAIPDECESGPPPGKIDPTTGPIILAKDGGDVLIRCAGGCSTGAITYGIYEGTIGSWYSHRAVAGMCQETCGREIRVTPSVAAAYYLVVPHNLLAEGSYGTAFNATSEVHSERPRAPVATQRCAEFQMIAACP